ncbi:MAG: hypothetical protein Q4C56_07605 [Peptococcaceae bacterium]|nr:hypothetical protein [Peptococcaceae bacterium]
MSIEKSPRVERLKERAKHCCCRYCGGELAVRQIIFYTQAEARVELYCDSCEKIEYGVEKSLYASAKALVESMDFNYFPDLAEGEERKQMNIAKVCALTSWQMRYLGLLSDDGFKVPIEITEYGMDECTTIADGDLDELLEEVEQWETSSSLPEK